MSRNFDTLSVMGHILARKQQIEAATMLRPVAVQVPHGAALGRGDDGEIRIVTSIVGLPVTYGDRWALLYPLDILEPAE